MVMTTHNQGQETTAVRHVFNTASFVHWINREIKQESSPLGRYLCSENHHAETVRPSNTQLLESDFSFRQFGFGQSNPTYLITFREKLQIVLRKKPNQVAHRSAHAIHREYAVLQSIAKHNNNPGTVLKVPVPNVFVYCSDASIIGAEFYLMEFVKGRIFTDPCMPGMEHRNLAYESVMKTLAAIHSVELPVDHNTPRDPYAGRQLDRLTMMSQRQAAEMKTQVPSGLSSLSGKLRRLYSTLPPAKHRRRTILTHGDFKVDNLIFHATEPTVIAVLDWELCSLDGDPMADLANLSLMYTIPRGMPGMSGIGNNENTDIPNQLQLISMYTLFKYAVIVQGVAQRAMAGTASSAQASLIGQQLPMLLELGHSVLEENGAMSKSKL